MNDDEIKAAAKAAELASAIDGVVVALHQEDEDLMPYLRRFAEACVAAEREKMRATIADDAYAATFQSLGQYRSALLRAFLQA